MTPLDFEALKKNQKFMSAFNTLKFQTEFNTEALYPNIVNGIDDVVQSIQQEIKKLE
jgi:hypothetical protein